MPSERAARRRALVPRARRTDSPPVLLVSGLLADRASRRLGPRARRNRSRRFSLRAPQARPASTWSATAAPPHASGYGYAGEPPGAGDEPVPPPARRQPRRLVPVGRRGARPRARRGPADPALDRLRGLPLVPRDGARVVRGRRDRRADERAVRQRQGRPRGAARPRRALHGRRRRADRSRRLADDRVPHARRRAVLRRHVLPAGAPARSAELPADPRRGRRGVPRTARTGRRERPHSSSRRSATRRGGARRRASRSPTRFSARPCGRCADLRPGAAAASEARRSSRRPRRSSSCCAEASSRWSTRDARRDGRGRHVRPRRRRLPSLLGRRAAGSCRTSRRCSTTTRCSSPPTSTAGS